MISQNLAALEFEFVSNGGEFKEFRLGEVFYLKSSKRIFHAQNLKIYDEQIEGSTPYVVRATTNNGIRGYVIENSIYLNDGNTLSFAQDTFNVFYQAQPYFTGNKVKVLKSKFAEFNSKIALYMVSNFNHVLQDCTWGLGSNVNSISEIKILLPTLGGKINFSFMEKFIEELERERVEELDAYLAATGLKDYKLTKKEKDALAKFDKFGKWEGVTKEFNLKKLFGSATRGKRLKSADRYDGDLPFVTAGEADMGISAFISNDVEIFKENTVTIDMFGSTKYRNYKYGADDHVAVVHTENLSKYAAIYVATAIHKVANAGQFSYARNFYAKDADELNILLPVFEGQIDYDFMNDFIKAIEKLVIKDVVLWTERKITATRQVVEAN
nr:restriction endonuclease subunit S [uncultured Campylobacter sp.]